MLPFGGGEGEVDKHMVVSSLGQTSTYLWCLEKKTQQSWGRVGEVLQL